jgi:hypothetical protein
MGEFAKAAGTATVPPPVVPEPVPSFSAPDNASTIEKGVAGLK